MIEAKDGRMEDRGDIEFTQPIQFNAALMKDIDREILEVFDPDHMYYTR